MLAATGQLAKARQRYEQALVLREKLRAAFPRDIFGQRDLAFSYDNLGRVLERTGQLDQARQRYEQALALRESLSDADPKNTDLQTNLSLSYRKLGWLLENTGRLDQVRQRYKQALALLESLCAADPSNIQCQIDLLHKHVKLMLLSLHIKQDAEARRHHDAGRAIVDRFKREKLFAGDSLVLWAVKLLAETDKLVH